MIHLAPALDLGDGLDGIATDDLPLSEASAANGVAETAPGS